MRFLPRWRFFTWVILAFNILMLFATVSSAASNCEGMRGDELTACQAGTGIGIGVILVFWVLIDVILGIIWLITNRRQRECPACGSHVRRGETVCKKCGHDFRAALAK